MLRRQDVGHRVVVRRIVGVTPDRTLYTDALGELVDLTDTDLTIATDKGTVKVTADGLEFDARVRIDTPGEADYYRHGGIMQYVLRSLL